MPLYRKFKLGSASVAVWKMTETADELLSMLPVGYAAESAHLRDGQRRTEWLAVRLLLAELCGADARIVYDGAGKPLLCGADGHISVSHTKGYALLAHSPEKPVGVDIELCSRNASVAAERFVNPNFRLHVSNLYGKDCNAYMLAYWCICEALFKLVGNIGGTYKENVIVGCFELDSHGIIHLAVNGVSLADDREYQASYINEGGLFIVLVEDVRCS